MNAKTNAKTIIVTVADEHVKRIDEVAEQLREAGMEIPVGGVLKTTGLITGQIKKSMEKLRAVPGVLAVEEEPIFRAS
jgi:methylmalonyl-CoA mutase cobalamin-binding subunit